MTESPGNPAAAQLEPDLAAELVTANRILADQGLVDGFGHVSARRPADKDQFLMARSMAPALVTEADILTFDLDANAVGGDPRAPYLERFIHSEIYRARPDVMAVVHSHAPAVVPFSVVRDVPLRPVFHMGGFIGDGVPVYEIRDDAGNRSDLLIRNPGLGASLARRLGSGPAVLMRGHGATIVGTSLREAVFHAVYLVLNARIQAEAMRLGPVTFLTPEEGAAIAANNRGGRSHAGQMHRAWDLWAAAAGRAQPAARRPGGSWLWN
jgi:ribulose-5-phosphate 4-epimerase/fuculose-1-phosphate aldolase